MRQTGKVYLVEFFFVGFCQVFNLNYDFLFVFIDQKVFIQTHHHQTYVRGIVVKNAIVDRVSANFILDLLNGFFLERNIGENRFDRKLTICRVVDQIE
ncbi:hypothetical protein D3C80_1307800 [compost metagenome]